MTSSTEVVQLVRSDLELFISSKEIDEAKVENYTRFIEILYKKKLEWALSERFEAKNSIKIYGAYRLLYDSLVGSRILLTEAQRRGENPTTAEKLFPYFSKLVIFSKILETELIKNNEMSFSNIENRTIDLSKEAEALGIMFGAAGTNRAVLEKIQATITEAINL